MRKSGSQRSPRSHVPIGMNVAAGPELAAAVTNAGGLGVIGGYGFTPKHLRMQIQAIKEGLEDKNAPFGVDLLFPQVGGNARKTNVCASDHHKALSLIGMCTVRLHQGPA